MQHKHFVSAIHAASLRCFRQVLINRSAHLVFSRIPALVSRQARHHCTVSWPNWAARPKFGGSSWHAQGAYDSGPQTSTICNPLLVPARLLAHTSPAFRPAKVRVKRRTAWRHSCALWPRPECCCWRCCSWCSRRRRPTPTAVSMLATVGVVNC